MADDRLPIPEISVDKSPLIFNWEPVGKQMQVHLTAVWQSETVEVDTVDLAKAARRQQFAAEIQKKTGVPQEAIEARLLAIAGERRAGPVEKAAPQNDLETRAQEALANTPPAVIDDARQMLAAPNLIERISADLELVGVAGEEGLRLAIYLLGTSRLLDRPLAAIVQGQSSSGKSFVVESVAKLFPEESVVLATQMTPQALFHAEPGSLSHRWVVAGERSRIQNDDRAEATRALREMLSSGRLSKMMPMKIGNEIQTVTIQQDGPIAYVESTTRTQVFEEDASRCIMLTTDERVGQTKVILERIAREASGSLRIDKGPVIERHQALQRLLKPYAIVIPFAEKLSGHMGRFSDQCRTRRAFPMLLSFIEASTLLHQHQRRVDDDGCLIAEPVDYEIAVRLLAAAMDHMIGNALPGPTTRFYEELLECVRREQDPLPVPFTIDDVRAQMPRAGRSTIQGKLVELEVRGYLKPEVIGPSGRGRPPKGWSLSGRSPVDDTVLPSLEEVFGDVGAGDHALPAIPQIATYPRTAI